MFKGWKTIIFNVAIGLIATPNSPVNMLPPKYAIPTLFIGNLVLRSITTTPIGRSE